MSSFLSDFLLLLATTMAGLIAGYLIPRRDSVAISTQDGWMSVVNPAKPAPAAPADDFLLAVQRATEEVAAHVGAHSKQVHAISSELQEGGCDVAAIIARLISTNDSMEKQLADAESRMQDQAAMIEVHVTEARTDALTGLANRRAFDDEIKKHYQRFESEGTPATLLMLDIDYFKKLNDTYGHLVGDDVLKATSALLAKEVSSGEIVARYGGEEFAVILPESTALNVLRHAENLRMAFCKFTATIDKKSLQISASAGMASLLPSDNVNSWIRRADEALYHAKSKGRNVGYWHDGHLFHRFSQVEKENPSQSKIEEAAPSVVDEERQVLSFSAFMSNLATALTDNRRESENLSVILVRIDQFDKTSVRYGADASRLLYQRIGRMLLSRVGLKCYVGCFSHDSFGIIMPNMRMDEAVVTGLKIRNAIATTPIQVTGKQIEATVSMGIGDESGPGQKRPLIDRVKDAIAAASKLGGNQVVASRGDGFVQVSNSSEQSRKAH